MNEQREQPRVPVSYVSVDVRTTVGQAVPSEFCLVWDISVGGMRFVSHEAYEIGSTLRLTFKLPESGLSLRTEATVIHCQALEDGFGVGIQFRGLGLAEYGILREFVSKNVAR